MYVYINLSSAVSKPCFRETDKASRRLVAKEISPGRLAQQVASAQSIGWEILARSYCSILDGFSFIFLHRFIHITARQYFNIANHITLAENTN